MNPTPNTTRISPHMVRMWQMLNILFTIRSFEMKISGIEQSLRKCQKGPLQKQYDESIKIFKQRISDEEFNYNKLLNQMSMLCISDPAEPLALPKNRIIEYDDDPASEYHKRTCGGHSTY
jgi:hypothetical protein